MKFSGKKAKDGKGFEGVAARPVEAAAGAQEDEQAQRGGPAQTPRPPFPYPAEDVTYETGSAA